MIVKIPENATKKKNKTNTSRKINDLPSLCNAAATTSGSRTICVHMAYYYYLCRVHFICDVVGTHAHLIYTYFLERYRFLRRLSDATCSKK